MTSEPPPDDASAAGAPRAPGRRWLRRAVLALFALAALCVLYVGVTFVQVWHESTVDHAGPADAIVVLGAAQYDGRPSPVFQERLDHALELYQQGLAPLLVTTGSKQEGDRFTEGFAGYGYLRAKDVPDEHIVVVTTGTNSYEELAAAARALGPQRRHVLLVSSAYHSLRIEHIADEVGLVGRSAPVPGHSSLRSLARETVAVAAGRVIGYRRLSNLS